MIYCLRMLIREVYRHRPKTVTPAMSIRDVLKRMLRQDVNGYIVVKERRVVGVISLQDIAAMIVPEEFRENLGMAMALYKHGFFHDQCVEIGKRKVADIMRRTFLTVDLHTNMMAVMTDFLNNDLYIVPVVEKGRLIGVVTRSEVKRAIATGMRLL